MNDTKPLRPLILLRRVDMSFPGPWEASLLGHMILTYKGGWDHRGQIEGEGVPSRLVLYGRRSDQGIVLLHGEGGSQQKRW